MEPLVLDGKYLVGDYLGSGSFSVVHGAIDITTNRSVACKFTLKFRQKAQLETGYKMAQLEIAVYKAMSQYEKTRLYSVGEFSLTANGDDDASDNETSRTHTQSYTVFYCVVSLTGRDIHNGWKTIVNHGHNKLDDYEMVKVF